MKPYEYFKHMRLKLEKSQAEIAEAVGHKQAWLQKIEQGEFEPKTDDLFRLCDALKIELTYLRSLYIFKKDKK